MYTLLLLEDDALLSQTLVDLLSQDGFHVLHAADGEEALELCYQTPCDIYLLDINVPRLNGIDFLSLLRESGDETPAFFLSALRDIATVSKAFDAKCDDYIKKPFEFDELLVRIKAHLHRKNPLLHYGALTYDLESKRLMVEGKEVDLGSVEKEILDLLLRHLGKLVHKEQFFEVMDRPSDLALRVHIAKLKKRFALELSNAKGIGYRLESV